MKKIVLLSVFALALASCTPTTPKEEVGALDSTVIVADTTCAPVCDSVADTTAVK